MLEVELSWNDVAALPALSEVAADGDALPDWATLELLAACANEGRAAATLAIENVRCGGVARRHEGGSLHVRCTRDGELFVVAHHGSARAQAELICGARRRPLRFMSQAPARPASDDSAVQMEVPADARATLGMRALRSLHGNAEALSASLDPASRIPLAQGFLLDPRAIDACMQLARRLAGDPAAGDAVLAIERIELSGPARSAAKVHVSRRGPGMHLFDAAVIADDGRTLVSLFGLRFGSAEDRRLERGALVSDLIERAARDVLGMPALRTRHELAAAGASSLDLSRIRFAIASHAGWAPALSELLPVDGGRGDPPEALEPERLAWPSDAAAPSAGVLTHAETRLWYIETHAQVAPAYNELVCWLAHGSVDAGAFEAALQAFVRRHDALGCTFVSDPEHGVQRRERAAAPAVLTVEDIADVSPGPELVARLRAFARPAFDLALGPLLRAALFRAADGRALIALCCHHIVCDEWSLFEIARKELGALYQNPRATLPAAGSIAELAAWERSAQSELAAAQACARWARVLRDFPSVLELPADAARAPRAEHRGKVIERRLPVWLTSGLQARARALQVTPFCLLLSAFGALIERISGQSRFLIGVPVSLRKHLRDEALFGCLINVVPIAFSIAVDETWASLARVCSSQLSFAVEHADAPFERIADALHCPRTTDRSPLIQVAISLHDQADASLRLGTTEATPWPVSIGTSKFDLMVEIIMDEHGASLRVERDSALFEPRRIERWVDSYQALLTQLSGDPEARVRELALPAALGARMQGMARTLDEDFRRRLFHGVQLDAAAIAVRADDGNEHSYERLQRAVSATAAALGACAGERDQVIAVLGERSFAWIVAVLAVLRVGRGYLPITTATPAARALKALQASGTSVLLTTGVVPPWCTQFGGEHIAVVESGTDAQLEPLRPLVGSVAYAITTSGSTGEPKLAAVSFAGVANLLDWYIGTLELSAADNVLLATSVGFDLTQKNVLATLCVGARVAIAAQQFDPEQLLECLQTERISVLNCTPSMFGALLLVARGNGYQALRGLRSVVLGGEPLDAGLLSAWVESGACAARVLNSYGPTECSDVCAAHWVTGADLARGGAIPLGLPIQNALLEIIDERGELAPAGAIGELLISGVPLGVGYLGAGEGPPSGFVALPGKAAYRTGDCVSLDGAGRLLFHGRRDAQVKVRGFRIELSEVELQARRLLPELHEVVVAAVGERSDARTLCAYYVAEHELNAIDARRKLGSALPEYMLPSRWVRLDALPRTESQKIDRARLPAPPALPASAEGSELERAVAVCLAHVLGVPCLDVDGDFFDCGGSSLLAVAAVERVSTLLSQPCRVQDLFEARSPRELAARLAYRSKPGA